MDAGTSTTTAAPGTSAPNSDIKHMPKVTTQPFTVVLKKLTEAKIKQHTGVKITPEQPKSRSDIKLKTPDIQLNKLLLQQGQCVKSVSSKYNAEASFPNTTSQSSN